ncbi:hypothetical protein PRO82_000042 [Candidatus Protochlamydia amoebophila]|nr:hypothetical protein [Candidatus Protochlamydia amoebophila]
MFGQKAPNIYNSKNLQKFAFFVIITIRMNVWKKMDYLNKL